MFTDYVFCYLHGLPTYFDLASNKIKFVGVLNGLDTIPVTEVSNYLATSLYRIIGARVRLALVRNVCKQARRYLI